MISVCIPVFNFSVCNLVNELTIQLAKSNVVYEIILIDDASATEYRDQYKTMTASATYIQLGQNIGRASIRNLFLQKVQYDHLLFLDCDSIVFKADFIVSYLNIISKYPNSVLCGGRIYPNEDPGKEKRLNWKYGIKVESKSTEERSQHAYASFMTNNFIVSKKILNSIRFDERLNNYGHEDTLWGNELRKNNIEIIHIDNPVLNGAIENNTEFLRKTRTAITNLLFIEKNYSADKELLNCISLIRFYDRYKFAAGLFNGLFIIFSPLIVWLLKRGIVNLKLFSFYKLGYFIHIKKQQKSV